MVWRADGPQGSEADKVRPEIVQYFQGRCLDLGCGPRKVFPSKDVIGIDSNKDALLFGIKANPDMPGDVTRLDVFADATIDTVFSSHTLEHVDDHVAALREWWRLLKVGGYLVLYLPHRDWYPNIGMPGANADHKHDFRNEDIIAAMEEVAWRSGKGWKHLRDEVRYDGDEYSFLQVYRKRGGTGCIPYVAQPKPEKSVGIVRLGAYGDALWISTILPALKKEYGHVTLYTQRQGEASLRHDPNIDKIVVQPDGIYGTSDEANARAGHPSVAELQMLHIAHLGKLHTRMINLIGSVEGALLPHLTHSHYWLPDDTRRAFMQQNYVETIHRAARVPFDRATVKVRFYPSKDELAWALAERAKHPGKFVVINPSGSSLPKWWPHAQKAMELFAAKGVGGVLLGELRDKKFTAPEGWQVIGTDWDIRRCYTLAALADVVIGTESAIINSVANEAPLKMVLMSHSTSVQLTRDWDRTIALEPENLPCYPCHRIHISWQQCAQDKATGAAACQAAATAEVVVDYAMQWMDGEISEKTLEQDILAEVA
jgi:ubiquinone/menaquinone biosynthesis C-methylase UbiE